MITFNGDEWFISDTHFNHKADWCNENRPENWQEKIIRQWRHYIKDSDVVVHLGDLELGTASEMDIVAPQLTGIKLLVKGNHDKRTNTRYRKWGFLVIEPGLYWSHIKGVYGDVVLCHDPVGSYVDTYVPRLHGHQHKQADGTITHTSPIQLETSLLFNCNVQFNDYQPIRLKSILKQLDRKEK